MVRVKRFAAMGLMLMVLLLAAEAMFLQAPRTAGAASRALKPRVSSYLPMLRFHMRGMDGPYHTQGNLILGTDNQPYLFHGVARDDLEYLCAGDGHYTMQDLGHLGMGNSTAQALYWEANTIRLPLSESFWLYGSPSQRCSANTYQTLVKQVVRDLTALNLNVIVDLQWTDAGGQAPGSGDAWSMPDQDSLTFWQQMATLYKTAPNVLFEIFNETHNQGDYWDCWRNGCKIVNDTSGDTGHDHFAYDYQGFGMQRLLDTIRQAGADNLVIVGGTNWGYNLDQIPAFHLNGINVVYDTHPYPYYGKEASTWDKAFGNISALYPVISSESGEYDCRTVYIGPLLNYFDAHDISWIGWAWAPTFGDQCSYPRLNADYKGTPAEQLGTLIYQHLHEYLNVLANGEEPARPKEYGN